jgi:hypothetical protein
MAMLCTTQEEARCGASSEDGALIWSTKHLQRRGHELVLCASQRTRDGIQANVGSFIHSPERVQEFGCVRYVGIQL